MPLPEDLTHPATGAFQRLVGAQAVLQLGAEHGFEAVTAADCVAEAVRGVEAGHDRAVDFLCELAVRVATGVAAICVVLDPGLVVLGGDVGQAGGRELASRVASDVGRFCLATPQVVATSVTGNPVLRGAILAAVDQARAELLDSVAEPV